MTAQIHQFMCLSDNFGVLIHDTDTGATAAIDAPEAGPILSALKTRGWPLTDILITHRHADHTQGVPELLERFPKARVVAPKKESATVPSVSFEVSEGDIVRVGSLAAAVIETPGHTVGHVAYWFEEAETLFAGDTLFSLGCGRVFETGADVMWSSLVKLASLPPETRVYCGHEYTVANGRFALTVDPGNAILRRRFDEAQELRQENDFTLPTTIQLELVTNPFLRAENPEIQTAVGMPGADPAAVFAELRERKNRF